jgi:hypothetical protein
MSSSYTPSIPSPSLLLLYRDMVEVYVDKLRKKGKKCFDAELYISASPYEFAGCVAVAECFSHPPHPPAHPPKEWALHARLLMALVLLLS